MTKQRNAIFDIIQESHIHMTAEQIFVSAKKRIPSISLGTVYRNLGVLVEQQMIRRVSTPVGKDVFDKNIIPHAHQLCPICGKVIDFKSEYLENFFINFGKDLISYELTLNMLCKDCKKN